jgi:hypothetical protein
MHLVITVNMSCIVSQLFVAYQSVLKPVALTDYRLVIAS